MYPDTPSSSFGMPCDVITDILLKLPVKTLLRFRSVCKSWAALISDANFHSIHQRKVVMPCDPVTLPSPGIIPTLVNYSRCGSVVRHSSPCTMYPDSIRSWLPDELKSLFTTSIYQCVFMIGPFDGVYLVYDVHGNGALWNHATKKFKIVSKGNRSDYVTYRFGSESMVDGRTDFVLLRLHVQGGDRKERAPQLYRLSTGTWTDLNPLPREYNYFGIYYSTVYINGVFYWMGHEGTFLMSFDTRDLTIRKLDLPDLRRYGYDENRHIWPLSCCTINDVKLPCFSVEISGKMHLWVLKESWVEEATYVRKEVHLNKLKVAANPKADVWFYVYNYEESLFEFANSGEV